MKNIEEWKPTKFVINNGKLKASRNPKEVAISSRFVADIVAEFYHLNLKKYAKGHLLDLGCGKVPFYESYRPYITKNTCVDWENSVHKNKYLDFPADLNQPLPLESKQFDTIILSDVLEHIFNPKLLWNEMNRVMKKDAYLFLNVPFFYWLHEQPHDYYRYTKYALNTMAENSGFKIIKINATGGVPEILTDICSKTAMRIPYLGKLMANAIQNLTRLFLKFKIGKKISKSTSNNFPLGYVLIAQKINEL